MRTEEKIMRFLAFSGILWILLGFAILASADCPADPNMRQVKGLLEIKAQLEKHLAPDAVPVDMLSEEILKKAREYEVDPDIVVRIVLTESRGRAKAINKRSKDYGLMQINLNTARAYGISMKCLMDWKCNLEKGIEILSDMPGNRACRFNVGTGPLRGIKLRKCVAYEQKLASFN